MKRKYFIGMTSITNEGYVIEIIEELKDEWLRIRFNDLNMSEKLVKTSSFLKGSVKNPYHPSVCKKGYIGDGAYSSFDGVRHSKSYDAWRDMIRRCYGNTEKNPTYNNVEISSDWLNYQNFAKFYEENYPHHIKDVKFQLDKDILCPKDNKIYSEKTCIFIPQKINSMLTTIKSSNTSGHVGIREYKDRWIVTSSDFNTSKKCHVSVKYSKEEAIKSYIEYRKIQDEIARNYLRSLNYLPEEIIQLIKTV